MNKTIWKPESEINNILDGYASVGIISCGTCANLSGTGGRTGIEILKKYLTARNKQVKMTRVILACCPEEIMRQTLKTDKNLLKNCEALIVLSCAAGIKSANSCKPGLPLISLLDSVGSAAVSCSDPVLARSLCRSCGHCVLTYTAGICPLSECPAKSKYGPCKSFSESNLKCTILPQTDCVWHIIRERSDKFHLLPSLKILHEMNEARNEHWLPKTRESVFWNKFFAWFAVHIQRLERVIRLFR